MDKSLQILQQDAIGLLKELINTPSFSKQEDQTAGIISRFLAVQGLVTSRIANNVFAFNKYFDAAKPSVLLNSHHDTVKPNSGYTLDPFSAIEKDGKLFGLGSNDAGGPLVSLIATFIHFYEKQNLKYNLLLAATAEEEISGSGGIEMLLNNEHFLKPLQQKEIDCAIVGEPTQMQMAVAERGLLVLDCIAHGKAGHAARDEGDNALNKAVEAIDWFRHYRFTKISDLLGEVKMNVTVIETDNKA
ncbi:MAG TPA: M20/M25/M40 family metallo-hydrolase, partial [Chitinophagaceae bacterium]